MYCTTTFYLAWTKSRKSYCTTPGVGVGVCVGGGGISKKFNVKVFYVMGKASYPVPMTGLVHCHCR